VWKWNRRGTRSARSGCGGKTASEAGPITTPEWWIPPTVADAQHRVSGNPVGKSSNLFLGSHEERPIRRNLRAGFTIIFRRQAAATDRKKKNARRTPPGVFTLGEELVPVGIGRGCRRGTRSARGCGGKTASEAGPITTPAWWIPPAVADALNRVSGNPVGKSSYLFLGSHRERPGRRYLRAIFGIIFGGAR